MTSHVDFDITERIQKSKPKQRKIQGFISWPYQNTLKQQEIKSMVSIGRDKGQTIALTDPFVSRRHARIEKKEDSESSSFVLKDMGSRNGISLNGNKVFQAILKDNDRIIIGQTEFVFSFHRFENSWQTFNKSKNPNWSQKLSRIPSIAQTDFPVLIHGPTGTGKENVAQMIHQLSQRSSQPYVSINCSALSENLAESEFFGHVKGSYTGASGDRKGAFLSAHKGTLFLDEIGDLPISLQPKLLRALEYKEIKPIGSDKISRVDVRILSATHQNLQEKVLKKEFREDLYFRLRVLEVQTLCLKDRMEDFKDLLKYFSNQIGVRFSEEAQSHLQNYHWPGNIRELKNTVSRAKAFFPHSIVEAPQVQEILDPLYEKLDSNSHTPYPNLLKKLEREVLIKTLKENKGNKSKTADQLNIPRTTLIQKLKSHGVSAQLPTDFD